MTDNRPISAKEASRALAVPPHLRRRSLRRRQPLRLPRGHAGHGRDLQPDARGGRAGEDDTRHGRLRQPFQARRCDGPQSHVIVDLNARDPDRRFRGGHVMEKPIGHHHPGEPGFTSSAGVLPRQAPRYGVTSATARRSSLGRSRPTIAGRRSDRALHHGAGGHDRRGAACENQAAVLHADGMHPRRRREREPGSHSIDDWLTDVDESAKEVAASVKLKARRRSRSWRRRERRQALRMSTSPARLEEDAWA